MNTTSPSKNVPAVASSQMRHCMGVIGANGAGVPSAQPGVSSMQAWTLRPACSLCSYTGGAPDGLCVCEDAT